jgi:hypothetical protein
VKAACGNFGIIRQSMPGRFSKARPLIWPLSLRGYRDAPRAANGVAKVRQRWPKSRALLSFPLHYPLRG